MLPLCGSGSRPLRMFAGAAWSAAALFSARGEAGRLTQCFFREVIGQLDSRLADQPAFERTCGGRSVASNGQPRFDSFRMPTFKVQFPASEIEALATRFGYADDARLLAVGAAARTRGYYTREEFVEACAWKTARSRPKVASNTEAAVVEATSKAFAVSDEATRMNALLELEGVGVPTASTLLYVAFPDDYPILDVRALESLGVKPRSQYPVSFWLQYLTACRELARRRDVSIRTLDKALWQYSKERGAGAARGTS
jgi:hypothetical protein